MLSKPRVFLRALYVSTAAESGGLPEMTSSTIFAVPATASSSRWARPETPRKRKRGGRKLRPGQSSHHGHDTELSSDVELSQTAEYTAVVTPAERSQRRLAGLPLSQTPPPFPFPHANPPLDSDQDGNSQATDAVHQRPHSKRFLHAQHLAAMTAVLHRCLMAQDYVRAGRALGLLLRNEVAGHAIDIRSEGFWGIGAEILLRQSSKQDTRTTRGDVKTSTVSREGFEHARLYYERLIVQYPKHKTWPDAVNALDFCIAMFGLWIYVTDKESLQLQRTLSPYASDDGAVEDADRSSLEAKRWESEQARQIAAAMDLRMSSAPFDSDLELIRLRAMVALWTADLIVVCAELEQENQPRLYASEQEDKVSEHIERAEVDRHQVGGHYSTVDEAVQHRNLASLLFSKLRRPR